MPLNWSPILENLVYFIGTERRMLMTNPTCDIEAQYSRWAQPPSCLEIGHEGRQNLYDNLEVPELCLEKLHLEWLAGIEIMNGNLTNPDSYLQVTFDCLPTFAHSLTLLGNFRKEIFGFHSRNLESDRNFQWSDGAMEHVWRLSRPEQYLGVTWQWGQRKEKIGYQVDNTEDLYSTWRDGTL